MKLFIDSADVEVIRSAFETGLIDGVTTNPTLIRKSGRDPEDVYQELIDMGVTDVSMEVVGDDEIMLAEGRRLANKFGKNATIKVPCSPEGLWVCKQLTPSVKVNVTLIFSPSQAILSAKAGASYVSPFVGRLDDNSTQGVQLIKSIKDIFCIQNVRHTQVLSASIRNVSSVSQSFSFGADVVTMPPSVFDKMYNHVLTDKGLEIFDADHKETQKMIGG